MHLYLHIDSLSNHLHFTTSHTKIISLWLLNSVLPVLKDFKSNSYLWVMPCDFRIYAILLAFPPLFIIFFSLPCALF
ncbi:hypothetical protein [Helicobacter sp. T3_23-1059]